MSKSFTYAGETYEMEKRSPSGAIHTTIHVDLGNQPTFIRTLTIFGTYKDAKAFTVKCLKAAAQIREFRKEGKFAEANDLERSTFQ